MNGSENSGPAFLEAKQSPDRNAGRASSPAEEPSGVSAIQRRSLDSSSLGSELWAGGTSEAGPAKPATELGPELWADPSESRWVFWVLAGTGLILAGLLWWTNPGDWKVPTCEFYRLTGYYCPGCGGLRAAHALLHGRWAEAWAYNPFLILLLPWAGYGTLCWGLSAWWGWRRWLGQWLYRPAVLFVVALGAVLFGILRNLPWEPFCHWAPGP